MDLSSILYTSFKAVFQVFLVAAVGFFLGVYPKSNPTLNRGVLRSMSLVSIVIFIPFISFASLASRISLELLNLIYPTFIWQIIIHFTAYISTYLAFKLLLLITENLLTTGKSDNFMQRMNCLGYSLPILMAFQNGVIFLIPIVTVLCRDSTTDLVVVKECEELTITFLFTFGTIWQIFFWSVGYIVIEREVSGVWPGTDLRGILKRLANPVLVMTIMGILGLWPGLKNFLFYENGFGRVFGESFVDLGQPATVVMTLILGASLAHSFNFCSTPRGGGKHVSVAVTMLTPCAGDIGVSPDNRGTTCRSIDDADTSLGEMCERVRTESTHIVVEDPPPTPKTDNPSDLYSDIRNHEKMS
eukprot:GHVL01021066.1.p1 GENE.GHVL01021066.1~~GHVL01021066.1.p1  ORF type:complete len:365 (+),score=37.56 GHVL01021066.1:24-1097(+)